jgi:ABC-type transporter Mla MlaB component
MSEDSQETTMIEFDSDCTIYEITDLYGKIIDAFKKEEVIKLDCSKVQNIDPSFIQLLIAAQIEAKRKNTELEIVGGLDVINKVANNMYCEFSINGFKSISATGE